MTKVRTWLAVLLLCGGPWLAMAQGVRAEEFVVGVEDLAYLPYSAIVDGEYRGYFRDLLDAYAADRGHSVRYRPLPVERLYRELLAGGIDFKLPDNPQWRRDLKADKALTYSDAAAPYIDGVMVPPARLGRAQDQVKLIGTIRGFTPWALLPKIERGEIDLLENNSIGGLLRQVLSQRIDGAYVNADVARYQLEQVLRKPGALVLDTRFPLSASTYRLSTLKHPAVVTDFDAWLADNRQRVAAMQRLWGIGE